MNALTYTLALALLVPAAGSCKKRLPAAKAGKHERGYVTVEALGRGVFEAINSKTLFRVRHLFPTQELYDRYFTCGKNPIAGMGRYHADGLYGVMRHKTEHGKVAVQTLKTEQPLTKRRGEKIGTCTFKEDVPHKLLTVSYSYRAPAKPAWPSMAPAMTPTMAPTMPPATKTRSKTNAKLVPKLGSWTFVTAQLHGRWYLFIILAMDGQPIDEIGLNKQGMPAPKP